MAPTVSIGDEAPNFDLTSTEDVVIMLRDEVPRSAVLLYVFSDPFADATREDLQALATAARRLAELYPGDEILLLEARLLGQGASGRSSGFAVAVSHFTGGFEAGRMATYGRINRIIPSTRPSFPAM